MDEDEILARFGTHPQGDHLVEVRTLLEAERRRAASADTLAMKLLCVQLFNHGSLDDVLLIWRAKQSCFDAACSIDVELLCGAGLDETKRYLRSSSDAEAKQALDYLTSCGLDGFSPAAQKEWYDHYYGG